MIIKRKNSAEIDLILAAKLAAKLKLPKKFIELLFLRGFDNEESIRTFLETDKESFFDPFLLKGMAEAVERVRLALQNNEKILIYSDYDADGICSSAILSLYFSSLNMDVYVHIPNRNEDGYGLNVETLEQIIENVSPDLIITCDCGISCHNEVEYVLDLGVDIIVTDHHEVGDIIPNCVIINPHQSDCNYPFKSLCGAGVALKLVHALGGEATMTEFLDLAGLATVADLVPLLGENRLIARRGLEAINSRRNMGIARLLTMLNIEKATSSDIAFKLAPRINAAGRMGDASRAFDLLTLDNYNKVALLAEEIERDNDARRQLCDKIYDEAVERLKSEKLYNCRSIVLSDAGWEKGITGIVAARLAGDFRRPCVIMAKAADGIYKGTARSVSRINIYEIIKSLGHLLTEFGGHCLAAGFSILEQNIPEFKKAFEEGLEQYSFEHFLPEILFDIDISEEEISKELVAALDLLEPYGHDNPRPLFRLKATDIRLEPCKSSAAHTQIITKNGLSIFAFNSESKNMILSSEGEKNLITELQFSPFNPAVYSGVLKFAGCESIYIDDELARGTFIKTINLKTDYSASVTEFSIEELEGIVGDNIYGCMLIAGCAQTYSKINLEAVVLREFIKSTTKNNYTRLIVSPEINKDLIPELYEKIVFLDSPPQGYLSYIAKRTNAAIFVPKKNNFAKIIENIDLSRETFGKYYEIIRKNRFPSQNVASYCAAIKRNYDINLPQLVACLTVFSEIGLISISGKNGFSISISDGVKTTLDASQAYREFLSYK